MNLTVERVVDGLVETLEREVLPDLQSRFARGQLHAALDVLANLRDRIEWRTDLLRADAEATATALTELAAGMREAGLGGDAAAIETGLAEAPAEPPAARAEALRAEMVAALEVVATLAPETGEALEGGLRGYLVQQAVRDVVPLKTSRLGDIAKGEPS